MWLPLNLSKSCKTLLEPLLYNHIMVTFVGIRGHGHLCWYKRFQRKPTRNVKMLFLGSLYLLTRVLNAGLLLGQRRRWWPSIKPALSTHE